MDGVKGVKRRVKGRSSVANFSYVWGLAETSAVVEGRRKTIEPCLITLILMQTVTSTM